jgi:hypothetical protein
MNNTNKEIIRRLLKNATLTFKYDTTVKNGGWCCIGLYGSNPLYIDNEFAKYLVNMNWVDLVGGNEYYNEEEFMASEKLKSNIVNVIYSIGDTVEYWHVYNGRKKGVITQEGDPLGLNVLMDWVTNVQYPVEKVVVGRTRKVLTEKTVPWKNIEYDQRKSETYAEWLKDGNGY